MRGGRHYGRKIARALLAAVAALVLLVGVLRANARYFYCPLMDLVVARSCCEPSREGAPEGPAIEVSDCCEEKRIAALPSGDAVPAPNAVPDAPLATVLPASSAPPSAPLVLAPRATLDARYRGPPPPGAARARFMVFLI
jgi:hypothetical protein